MSDLSIIAGATSQSINLYIRRADTGAGLTGVAYNTSGLSAYYSFCGASAGSAAITLASLVAVNSAWSSGGFKEIDSVNMPGFYRLDLPNAALASGKGREVDVILQGVSNMTPVTARIELTAWDNQTTLGASVLASTMDESYPTKGNPMTAAQALYNLVQLLGEKSIASTLITVLKRDQATPAKTYTLDSATSPTSSTETT